MIKPIQQSSVDESGDLQDGSYLGQTILQLIKRESLHEVAAEKFLCWQTQDGQAFGYNTDDQHLLNFVPQLRRLYDRIVDDDESVVTPTFVRWANRSGVKLTSLGRQVLGACNYYASQEEDQRNWQEAYANHRFHPVVAVMLRAVMRWWRPICQWGEPSHALVDGFDPEAAEKLRQFVEFIRGACRSQEFQTILRDHERKAEDNFASSRDYVSAMFERRARMLILRIDLYFRPDAKGWGYSKAANKAIFSFLRALRRGRIVPGYLGFWIKRENGISRGMHYHLMVFIDGDKRYGAWFHTQAMGEAWMKRVGYDKGSFFNCYARSDRYRYNGLGLVHVSDVEKLIGLRIALWYMTKQDCELKVDNGKKRNCWGSLKPGKPDGRGAPRKNGNGLDLVRRMLGGKRSKYPPGFVPPKQERAKRHRSAQTEPGIMGQVAPLSEGQSQGL
jgi:hypothetical protein